jgi:zinc D-Ala-D-Ala carboxypeptidase
MLVAAVVVVALSVGAVGLGAYDGVTRASASHPRDGQPASASPFPSSPAGPDDTPVPTGIPAPVQRPTPLETPAAVAAPVFDRAARSIDDPASLWVVVNKKRPLNPATFVPPDLVAVPVAHVYDPELRQEASAAVVALFAAASAEAGLQLQSQSSYRGYETQLTVYTRELALHGQAFVDTDTARPGYSEHQTGLAIDISSVPSVCALTACFGETPHGQWLAANAWRFGFNLSYPADKTQVTGYAYEPWHFRYVGVELATEMHRTGVTTLEEFFGLPAAPTY